MYLSVKLEAHQFDLVCENIQNKSPA